MCQKLETWICCFLLSLVWFFSGEAYGLSCNFCHPVNDYPSCLQHGGSVECTEALVNMTHLLLVQYNPSLGTASPVGGFQCFQVNYTVSGATTYQMGCTFAKSHLCEGWTMLNQCKITDGTSTPNQQGYGTPTKSGPSLNVSTTPLTGSGTAKLNPTSMAGPTQKTNHTTTTDIPTTSQQNRLSTHALSRTTTTTMNTPTTSQQNRLSTEAPPTTITPNETHSRAHGLSIRFDLLSTLLLLHIWCQNV